MLWIVKDVVTATVTGKRKSEKKRIGSASPINVETSFLCICFHTLLAAPENYYFMFVAVWNSSKMDNGILKQVSFFFYWTSYIYKIIWKPWLAKYYTWAKKKNKIEKTAICLFQRKCWLVMCHEQRRPSFMEGLKRMCWQLPLRVNGKIREETD